MNTTRPADTQRSTAHVGASDVGGACTESGADGEPVSKADSRIGPDTDWHSDIHSPDLLAVGERIARAWHNDLGEAIDEDEFLNDLILLLRTLESEDEIPEWTPETTASQILRRRLVELVRTGLVERWSAHGARPDADRMLALMQALERAREQLEPRWDQRFQNYLAAPGGMDLVVEVAHDLRSPLTSILFLSETLRKGQSGDVNDIQRRQLGIIYSAALALQAVVSDVIDLARDGNHLVDAEPSPFSVTEMLQLVFDVVQPMAEEKGLTIWITPPATDQRLGYPVALSRVLLNLVTNAIKFTDEGGVEISVTARGISRVVFSVRDTGRGINPEVMSTLFQPVRRTRARKGFYFSGSGLGLAICRRLVEAMNATLEVDTEPDEGTRFFFEMELPPASPLG